MTAAGGGDSGNLPKTIKGVPKIRAKIGPFLDITASKGSVLDLEDDSGVTVSGTIIAGGVQATFDKKGDITGGGIHAMLGGGISVTGSKTEVFSARRGIERAVNATAEIVDKAARKFISNIKDRFLNPRPVLEE